MWNTALSSEFEYVFRFCNQLHYTRPKREGGGLLVEETTAVKAKKRNIDTAYRVALPSVNVRLEEFLMRNE